MVYRQSALPVPAPQLEPVASLEGGRLADGRSRSGAASLSAERSADLGLHFRSAGLELNTRRTVIGNREVFLPDGRGYQVAVFRDRGLGYAVTGTMNEPDFLKVVSAMVSGR